MKFEISPVATVHNKRNEITDDFWGDMITEIRLADDMPDAALDGIELFSHAEIIYVFDKADPAKIVTGSSHPRGNPEWPLCGIFAQRKKDRPNHIGACICNIVKHEGRSLFVANLDAIDGTPVIDIKPVLKEFLPIGEQKQPAWASELMKDYWK